MRADRDPVVSACGLNHRLLSANPPGSAKRIDFNALLEKLTFGGLEVSELDIGLTCRCDRPTVKPVGKSIGRRVISICRRRLWQSWSKESP